MEKKSGVRCYNCDLNDLDEFTVFQLLTPKGAMVLCRKCAVEAKKVHPGVPFDEQVYAPVVEKTAICSKCGVVRLDADIVSKAFADVCRWCEPLKAKPSEDKVTFTSGAQSSGVMPPYHLIPFDDCLPRLAARYQLGRDKGYALDNWRKGLNDDAYVADRLNHGLQHLMNAIAKITRGDYTNGEDDDLAGAMWSIVFGMAAQKIRGGVK